MQRNGLCLQLIIFAMVATVLLPSPSIAQSNANILDVYNACKNGGVWPQFDCMCIARKFVKSGTEVTSSALNEFFQQETRSGKTGCIAREVILKGQESVCERNFKPAFRNLRCDCFANFFLKKWEEYPFQRTAYMKKLHTDAVVACQ